MARRKRRCVDPTDDWEQLETLCVWPEQRQYGRIRPLVLFGEPVPERSAETGTPKRIVYRRVVAFRNERYNYQLAGKNRDGQTNDFR